MIVEAIKIFIKHIDKINNTCELRTCILFPTTKAALHNGKAILYLRRIDAF
jgi:hypothetical protein